MKILHVIAQLPSRTGSGVYYSNVIEELKKYGHEQAALFATQDDFNFDVLRGSTLYPVCFKSGRIPFPIVGMSDVMPYENTVYSSMNEHMLEAWRMAFEDELHRAEREFQPDILILHHLWILTSIATGIFDKRIKIGVCHNTDIRQAEQHPDMKNRYVVNLKNLDFVFSLSDLHKQRISDVFGIEQSKIITIGGGFSQKLFFPLASRKKNDKTRIVFSAKIEKSKGVFELVKAFKNITETNQNLHLDIIGTPGGESVRILQSLTGNADNITVIPIKNQKALADYIRDKDIFVMPSYFEGLGLMALECLASGLRVVATEIEALMSLLGDNVNNSGVIEYVKLPRIYDTDKPFDDDLEQFVENLSAKLLLQIERVRNGDLFPMEILPEINKHSWNGKTERINNVIMASSENLKSRLATDTKADAKEKWNNVRKHQPAVP